MTGIDRAAQDLLGGVDVIYDPATGDPVTVKGIFDNADIGTVASDLAGASVFLLLADLPVNPASDDPLITIAGTQYRVRNRQADGLGGIHLFLVPA